MTRTDSNFRSEKNRIHDAGDPLVIARAAETLRAGGLVAFPTETVYGLGADATQDKAAASIYAAKGRPDFNPLIVHVPDVATARKHVVFSPMAEKLADAFWPGAMTLVLPRVENCAVSKLCSAGLPTLAVRVPASTLAQDLLRSADRPVAAPSANRSGRLSPTRAHHVADSLGDRVDMILDGGNCPVGLESTVVGFGADDGAVLLRPGGISAEQLSDVVGPLTIAGADQPDAPQSPGMLTSHYAPRQPIRLNITNPGPDEALLAFGPDAPANAVANLSPTGDTIEAAANLFQMLHDLDALGRPIAVMPVPVTGLGQAINDRLNRAAAPR